MILNGAGSSNKRRIHERSRRTHRGPPVAEAKGMEVTLNRKIIPLRRTPIVASLVAAIPSAVVEIVRIEAAHRRDVDAQCASVAAFFATLAAVDRADERRHREVLSALRVLGDA